MGKTLYPPANTTAQWFAGRYPGTTFTYIEKVTLHTTEGGTMPGYDGGAIAPNLTAMPDFNRKILVWRHHFPINMSSRALMNLSGGVQTNIDNNVQVELVGTCSTRGPGVYWPDAPDWCYQGLAEFLKWMNSVWGVPMNFPPVWKPYPASWGRYNGIRLQGKAYDDFRGVLGHEHTAENDHGDPGALDINRLKKFIGTNVQAPTTAVEEYDMASFTEDQIKGLVVDAIRDQLDEIASEVWNRFAVRDAKGNLVKPLAALQEVFQQADTPDLTEAELDVVLKRFAAQLGIQVTGTPGSSGS